jgi:Rieske Fe-S protein
MTESSKDEAAGMQPERRMFVEIMAGGIGAVVGLVPFAAGVWNYLDPVTKEPINFAQLRGESLRDKEGYLLVANVKKDKLAVDQPKRFQVIDHLTDKWNYIPNQPIGSVYLTLQKDGSVTALNTTCPHAGCSVKLGKTEEGTEAFLCPCHNSAFETDGAMIQPTPSPRAMDNLACKTVQDEVWVKYEDFYAGKAEKKAKS